MNEMQTRLDIRVHPGAGRNEITGFTDGILGIKLTTQPEKGKANAALVKYLGEALGIAKSRIVIQKGTTSRRKTVVIEGLDMKNITDLIAGRKHS
jgi:uncharacterized protein (TIGR00251 family)